MSPLDAEIIEQVRRGASHKFAILVERYQDMALTLAMRILGNRQDAEEAAQDAFVRAFNALDDFEGNSKFSTWLYRIVYNVCLTRLGRRKEAFETVDYQDENQFGYDEDLQTLPADAQYESKDMIMFVKRLIDQLPTKYRTVLSLLYFQDMSYDEICEVTSLPLGTVKAHLFRARAMLQRKLAKELETEAA